ncbi:hybrid sensor histidine kinase/response regulator [Luteolibacter sp. LG18]|uniref:hybrid sensor histidine kinase/response regulator n=1 Tax=Luteolibacter sp. LG18 TaxID=2819286 RepID=UPI002B28275C|nr:hybrid sensor histidine kinase/response regulator [Luteolibacter sp. LG18]
MRHDRPVILVVDDEPKNIQVVGSLLLREGYEIITARGGEEGLEKAREVLPDLILLDVMMPGISGVEVACRLQDDPDWPAVPIIFLSAATDKTFIIEALSAGGVDYVTKPFHGPELLRRIELHLGLRRTSRMLEETIAEQNRLIEVLAHDLKNPLGSVRFSAKLLEEQAAGPKVDRLAGMILEGTDRAIEIVESLLEIRWVEHAKSTLSLDDLNLKELLNDVCKGFASRADEKGITIRRVDTPDLPKVRADRGCLLRVLENLISNALKFSPPQTTVTLVSGCEAEWITFTVEDEGPGIPTGETSRLFQRYARLSSRPTGGESSTGLGLSIVRELVHAMGGSIAYHPSKAGGASFQVQLPAAEA